MGRRGQALSKRLQAGRMLAQLGAEPFELDRVGLVQPDTQAHFLEAAELADCPLAVGKAEEIVGQAAQAYGRRQFAERFAA